jgi:PAS domain S-box-containing protein
MPHVLCINVIGLVEHSDMVQSPLRDQPQHNVVAHLSAIPWWGRPVGLAVAVCIIYFLSARLSLFLLTKPDGVAVFWPAAGVSFGILVALGRDARWPVAVGTMAATIVANLMGDRNIWSSFAFAGLNAGEALFAAWLVERYFGSKFSLGRLRHVLGLLGAAITATAVSGIGGAAVFELLHSSDAPALTVFKHWFTSDAIGIITVAPLIIGIASAVRAPPPHREILEGVAALAMVAAATGAIISLRPESWESVGPVALLFPLLLWIAARCRPIFSSAAVFIVSLTTVWAITFEMGQFGNPELSMADRILGAQIKILGVALCALVLAALFAERREHEIELEESEARLQEALAVGKVAAFDWDVQAGSLQFSDSAADILGLDPKVSVSATSFLARIHADDRTGFAALATNIDSANPSHSVLFRFIRADGREVSLEAVSKAEFDAAGHVKHLKGLTLDITERKRADERQAALMAELDHRVKNVLARVAVSAAATRQASNSVDQFVRSLEGRIQSMAAAHTLLSQNSWQAVGLAALVNNQLAPYATGRNVTIIGSDVMLDSAAIQAVAMVLHELVTNAVKYGALSAPGGHVFVIWQRLPNGDAAETLMFTWRERGGPSVPIVVESGYGSSLIRDLIPHELGGKVDLVFEADGVSCRIDIPL